MSNLILEAVQHSKLHDIDDIEPINQSDYDVLEEVREVLSKHNYTDRFGIVLLHKHFEVGEDEVLMEVTDEENRTSLVSPQKASEADIKNSIQTVWKFGHDVKAVTECVQFCHKFFGHNVRHKKVGK